MIILFLLIGKIMYFILPILVIYYIIINKLSLILYLSSFGWFLNMNSANPLFI